MLKTTSDLLARNGFTPGDQAKDFGEVIPYVEYATRVKDGRHQYFSIISYEGRFCEAVWEVYLKPKNTRRPKGVQDRKQLETGGYVAVETGLLRSLAEIEGKLQ